MKRIAESSLRSFIAVEWLICGFIVLRTCEGLKKTDRAAAMSPMTEKAKRISCSVKQPRRVLEQSPMTPEASVNTPTRTRSHPVRLGLCSITKRRTREAIPPMVTARLSRKSMVVDITAMCPRNVLPAIVAAFSSSPSFLTCRKGTCITLNHYTFRPKCLHSMEIINGGRGNHL